MAFSFSVNAQKEKITVVDKCPVSITDTLTQSNFFLELQPASIKVYRSKAGLTVSIEQKEQYFTLLFSINKLKNVKYKIGSYIKSKKEVVGKYSFRIGEKISYVNMTSGTVETFFNKETMLWKIKVDGLLTNYVGQSVTLFKVKADFDIR